MMTYAQATAHHLAAIAKLDGWESHTRSPKRYSPKPLKVPYAQHASGLRIYFKSQATWYGWDRPLYSLHMDRRTESTESLVEFALRMADLDKEH